MVFCLNLHDGRGMSVAYPRIREQRSIMMGHDSLRNCQSKGGTDYKEVRSSVIAAGMRLSGGMARIRGDILTVDIGFVPTRLYSNHSHTRHGSAF